MRFGLILALIVAGCGSGPPSPRADSSPARPSASLPPPPSAAPSSSTAPGEQVPARVLSPPADRLLACSISEACVVDRDGSVRCWGENHFGQLGVGTRGKVPGKPGPKVGRLPPIRSLAVGVHHACALARGGSVHCWGATYNGQTGDHAALPEPDAPPEPGPPAARTAPIAVLALPLPAVSLDAGVGSTCAVISDGTVYCWGSNDYGELGSAGPSSARPRPVPGVRDAVEIALGTEHACARSSRGEVTCWGTMTGGADPPTRLPGLCARQITAGSHFTCAIDCDGRPVCVGNVPGRPPPGGSSDRGLAVVPGAAADVDEIRAGHWHACLRDRSGSLACFGGNDSGQIGRGKGVEWWDDFADTPAQVTVSWAEKLGAGGKPDHVVQLCAGGMNIRPDGRYRRPSTFADAGATCALTSNDDVYCWGEPDLSYIPVHATRRK